MGQVSDPEINELVDLILDDYEDDRTINKIDIHNQPDKQAVTDVIDKLMKILFPGYYSDKVYKIYSLKNNMSAAIEDVVFHLKKQISIVLKYTDKNEEGPSDELDEKAKPFLELNPAQAQKYHDIAKRLDPNYTPTK